MKEEEEMDQLFSEALRENDADKAVRVVKMGLPVNEPLIQGTYPPPLHLACIFGSWGVVKALIDMGADINLLDEQYGYTAIYNAVGHVDLFKKLEGAGADLRARGEEVEPLISRAIIEGAPELAIYLIDKYGAGYWGYPEEDVLSDALLFAERKVVDHVMRKTSNWATENSLGRSILSAAMNRDEIDVIRELLEAGCDPDGLENGAHKREESRYAPIFYAESAEAVDLLIEYGSNINIVDQHGNNALGKCHQGEEVARRLIHHGIDMNHKNNLGFDVAYVATRELCSGALVAMVENGYGIELLDKEEIEWKMRGAWERIESIALKGVAKKKKGKEFSLGV